VCLQETKLSDVCNRLANECLGNTFDYAFLPAVNTAGGVLLGWRTDAWSGTNISLQSHSLTARLTSRIDARSSWWITVVYGPLDAPAQQSFLAELTALRLSLVGPWLLCGDFNMIYRAADKNNDRLDRRCMRRFGRFLGTVAVEELHLASRFAGCSGKSVMQRTFNNLSTAAREVAVKIIQEAELWIRSGISGLSSLQSLT
jgi:hypothetical protein